MPRDLDRALSDILAIRSQIAAGTSFQGFGPTAMAATGGLALVTTVLQSIFGNAGDAGTFLAAWVATAVVAAALIGVETVARARRHHSGLADEMIYAAIENFLPAAAAGALLWLVILRFAPDAAWMIPGLWQILVGLGTFASARTLPRPVLYVAAWYFVAGMLVLILASDGHWLSPWTMGVPFIIGQFAMAAVLHTASEQDHAES
jgi:hypothetical protein